jgi:hypothetical protein
MGFEDRDEGDERRWTEITKASARGIAHSEKCSQTVCICSALSYKALVPELTV